MRKTERPAGRRFQLVLIKPSHYDDDGYVIQWLRSTIPSNSLACLYGLAHECAERAACSAPTSTSTSTPSTRPTRASAPERIARRIARRRLGMVGLVGVQSNQFPRALDIARPLRAAGIHGGDRRLPCLRLPGDAAGDRRPTSQAARDLGVSMFAGEAEEGRLDEVLHDALAGELEAALQLT